MPQQLEYGNYPCINYYWLVDDFTVIYRTVRLLSEKVRLAALEILLNIATILC
jgi:hypothetical protein